MNTIDLPCSIVHQIETQLIQRFADAAYIVLRPTFELGDNTVRAWFGEAEEFWIDYGPTHGPSRWMKSYADVEEAVAMIIAIKAAYPHLGIWYDGKETHDELTGDVWLGLIKAWSFGCEWWEVAQDVVDGSLSPDDPEVLIAIEEVPLIAKAIAHIAP
ncbi:hypothetical protein ACQVP2_08635 [Methylobacterium aquaticum]|uniref:hypothetical protein n=1 Tax=Methylobacterium aquaticum TaxID=270351 RepID=UPI003D16AB5F